MLVAAHQVARYCCCCCTHLRCSGPWLAASEKWAPGLSGGVWMDILGSLALHLFIHEIEIIPEDYGRADKGNEKNVKSTCNNCVWGNVGGGAYHSSPLTRPHSLKDFHFTHDLRSTCCLTWTSNRLYSKVTRVNTDLAPLLATTQCTWHLVPFGMSYFPNRR